MLLLVIFACCLQFSLAELNVFYLKYVLWLHPVHWLVLARLVLFGFAGAVAIRETYQFIGDRSVFT